MVDAVGKPFLIQGDTAWSLIAQLTREDADLYLEDRRARGFNTIPVSLIEAKFATNAPANAYGQPPFLKPWAYDAPNEAYFRHADWVLRRAAEKGFLVLLTPSYLGFDGGPEGWYQAMVANGAERLHRYGEYLGRRYRDFRTSSGYTPATTIPTGGPGQSHCAWVSASTIASSPHRARVAGDVRYRLLARRAVAAGQQRLHLRPGLPSGARQYRRPERMPFFLIESAYENEHEATEQRLRTQAYQAVLSGAAGQIFGNNPIWHFDGPGLYPAPVTWQQALGSRGAQHDPPCGSWSPTRRHAPGRRPGGGQ